uniref:Uncharacterized protein n=1 Tax=Oryza rufipogon TaxID=4529 RepID=A0A0E0RHV4_ORYRU
MWVSSGLILQSTKGNSGQEKIAREHFNSGSGTLGDLTAREYSISPLEEKMVPNSSGLIWQAGVRQKSRPFP